MIALRWHDLTRQILATTTYAASVFCLLLGWLILWEGIESLSRSALDDMLTFALLFLACGLPIAWALTYFVTFLPISLLVLVLAGLRRYSKIGERSLKRLMYGFSFVISLPFSALFAEVFKYDSPILIWPILISVIALLIGRELWTVSRA